MTAKSKQNPQWTEDSRWTGLDFQTAGQLAGPAGLPIPRFFWHHPSCSWNLSCLGLDQLPAFDDVAASPPCAGCLKKGKNIHFIIRDISKIDAALVPKMRFH